MNDIDVDFYKDALRLLQHGGGKVFNHYDEGAPSSGKTALTVQSSFPGHLTVLFVFSCVCVAHSFSVGEAQFDSYTMLKPQVNTSFAPSQPSIHATSGSSESKCFAGPRLRSLEFRASGCVWKGSLLLWFLYDCPEKGP